MNICWFYGVTAVGDLHANNLVANCSITRKFAEAVNHNRGYATAINFKLLKNQCICLYLTLNNMSFIMKLEISF